MHFHGYKFDLTRLHFTIGYDVPTDEHTCLGVANNVVDAEIDVRNGTVPMPSFFKTFKHSLAMEREVRDWLVSINRPAKESDFMARLLMKGVKLTIMGIVDLTSMKCCVCRRHFAKLAKATGGLFTVAVCHQLDGWVCMDCNAQRDKADGESSPFKSRISHLI